MKLSYYPQGNLSRKAIDQRLDVIVEISGKVKLSGTVERYLEDEIVEKIRHLANIALNDPTHAPMTNKPFVKVHDEQM